MKAPRNTANPRHIRLELDTQSPPRDKGRVTHWRVQPEADIPADDEEPIEPYLRIQVYAPGGNSLELLVRADDADRLADAIRFAVLEARR